MSSSEIVFKNGDRYEGQVQNEKPHDKGKYRFNNGSHYQGQFENGKFHGQGKLVDTFNEIKISGWFKEGVPEGRVIVEYNDGSRYQGEAKRGFRSGKGTLLFGANSQQQQYRGQFQDDQMSGQGQLTFKNGDIYRGTFAKGVLHGNSQVVTKEYSYMGSVSHGIIEGEGAIKYASGDTYKGSFALNQKHGFGVYTYEEGGSYSGQWQRDQRSGRGKIVYGQGHQFEGSFEGESQEGTGRWEGWGIEGRLKDGMLEGSFRMGKPGSEIQSVYRNGKQDGLLKMNLEHKGQVITYRGQFEDGQEKPYSVLYSGRV